MDDDKAAAAADLEQLRMNQITPKPPWKNFRYGLTSKALYRLTATCSQPYRRPIRTPESFIMGIVRLRSLQSGESSTYGAVYGRLFHARDI